MRRHVNFWAILLLALVGCKTTEVVREVPVVVEHTSVTNHTDIVRDTLIMRDSVYHLIKGDTLIVEKWHTIQQINKVVVSDTVRDSVPVVTEVVKFQEVEKKLTKWQQAKMDIGGLAIGVTLAMLIGVIIYIIMRLRRMAK